MPLSLPLVSVRRQSIMCLSLITSCAMVVTSIEAGPPGRGGRGNGSGPGQNGPQGNSPSRFSPTGGQHRGQGPGQGGQHGLPGNPTSMIQQCMSLDTNGDGALSATEVVDPRIQQMLAPADVNRDGLVTLAELNTAMALAGGSSMSAQPSGRPPGRGQGINGPPPGRPGEVLPSFVQNQLQLSASQRQQVAALQARVDAELKKILSSQQRQQLQSGRL